MADETMTIQRIIEVHAERSTDTVKDLKTEISDLKDALLNVDKASEDYDKGLKLLREDQQRLNEVNALTKKSVDALPGSYAALNAELVQARKNYKELTPEERANAEVGGELLNRIQELDHQLKDMDASMGQFQRNVGSYESSMKQFFGNALNEIIGADGQLGSLGKRIIDLIPMIKNVGTAVKTASTTAANGFKAALSATGIGGIIVMVTTLIQTVSALTKGLFEQQSEVDKLKESYDALGDTMERQNVEMDKRLILMEAEGATMQQMRLEQVRLIEQQRLSIQAQIDETRAIIANLEAKAIKRKKTKEEIEELKSFLADLTRDEQNLWDKQQKLMTQNVAEEMKARRETTTAKKEESQEDRKRWMSDADYQRYMIQQRLALVQEGSAEELEILKEQRALEYDIEVARLSDSIENETERNAALEMARQVYVADILDMDGVFYDEQQRMREEAAEEERKAAEQRAKEEQQRIREEQAAWDKLHKAKIATVQNAFTTMLSLYEAFGGETAKQSEGYKAIASAQAVVQALLSANEAYASMASIPYVGPALGAVAAAAALAQGMAQVRAINATNMKGSTSAPSVNTTTPTASVSAPAVIQQVESTRTLTGVEEEQRMNNAQRVYLVYDDVQQAGKKVSVEQSESTF